MLQKIIDSGTLIGEGMENRINSLTEGQVELFLSLKQKPIVFDDNVWGAIVKPELKIIKKKYKSDKHSVQDLVNCYNKRLNVLREELLNRSELKNLTSVGSVKNSNNVISVIGMFDGKNLEDQTGMVELTSLARPDELMNIKNIIKNEVVGVVGKITNGKLMVEKIIYPDVRAKELKKAELPARVLISRDGKGSKNVTHVVVNNQATFPENIPVVQMDGFAEFDVQGVRFLVVKEAIGNCVNMLSLINEKLVGKEILQRRNLFYKNRWIETVPDIFVSLSKESFVENYRGITVVGLGNRPILLDLMTREVI
jgi:hypothetical protein